ncbi:MAG: cation:proton antiporter [Deltaproteobacteria bacterium]|nr:cation:proton antiporter [Deltaproteobacteria bacterium]
MIFRSGDAQETHPSPASPTEHPAAAPSTGTEHPSESETATSVVAVPSHGPQEVHDPDGEHSSRGNPEEGDHSTESHGEEGHGEEGHGGGDHAGNGHASPVTPVLFGLVIILVGAKLFGELFERVAQPAVLGELIFGVLMGNLVLLGFDHLAFISSNEGIAILAEIGVILLLFEVGLESNIREMLSVGPSSLLVAVLGIICPFCLGWGLSYFLLPELNILVHVFVGATLCATSVGITARVLADLGKLQSRETKVILGAAVIDDVLGLVILAVVQGAIVASGTGEALAASSIVAIIVKALVFLVGALVLGGWLSPRLFNLATALRIRGVLLALCLAFCFLLSYLANLISLAPIVGAFAAGLILDEVHYKGLIAKGEHPLEELLHPINAFLVPVFFVLMGTKVDLSTFAAEGVLVFALLLSLVAVVGKMICALGVLEKGLDRISIAVGMVPRGEVGLIFAAVGASLTLNGKPVMNDSVLSAVVIMVIITTLMTPPALKATLARADRLRGE